MKYAEKANGFSHIVSYEYDTINNLTSLVETINGTSHTTSYEYDMDNRITSVTNDSTVKSYTYDAYSRVSGQVIKNGSTEVLTTSYAYRNPTDATTTGQVSSLTIDAGSFDVVYTYTYDDNGNILSVSDGTYTTSYVYDTAGQLLRENNQAAGKTWVWEYDNAGNIKSRKEYDYTTVEDLDGVTPTKTVEYEYTDETWGDLLTSYDGQEFDYDEIGNLTDAGTWEYTWEHGRELASMTDGSTIWTYTYDANGMRTSRSNGTTIYKYVYNGSSLVQMTVGSNTLYFTSDTVTLNGTTYYYVTNLQGDIVAILNSAGTAVVQYTYDAWGNILSMSDTSGVNLGTLNPLRYRGYVYDSETQLYYLQSRCYDPEIGRFINADALCDTSAGLCGYNLFAYCANSPVALRDNSGFAIETILDVASVLYSLLELIASPSWTNAGYLLWDIASAIAPFIPGSYVAKGGKIALKIASKLDDFADGSKFLTGTYKQLKKLLKGIQGVEIHHLIEKRFAALFDCNINDFLSIPLAKELHQTITNRWRNLHKVSDAFKDFAYGSDYTKITYNLMVDAVKKVYYDVPAVLDEVLEWVKSHWKE